MHPRIVVVVDAVVGAETHHRRDGAEGLEGALPRAVQPHAIDEDEAPAGAYDGHGAGEGEDARNGEGTVDHPQAVGGGGAVGGRRAAAKDQLQGTVGAHARVGARRQAEDVGVFEPHGGSARRNTKIQGREGGECASLEEGAHRGNGREHRAATTGNGSATRAAGA